MEKKKNDVVIIEKYLKKQGAKPVPRAKLSSPEYRKVIQEMKERKISDK